MEKITVKLAKMSDINLIKNIYNDARSFGKMSGSCDWSDDYPNDAIIIEDITNEYLTIVLLDSQPIAVFSIIDHDDLDDEQINWNACTSGIPARICIKSHYQGKGLGKVIIRKMITIAKEKGYESLRLLASVNNIPANNLYRGLNFEFKGLVHLYQNDFNAYELLI